MTPRYLFDRPDPQFFAAVVAYAAEQNGRIRPGSPGRTETARLGWFMGAATAITLKDSILLRDIDVAAATLGMQAYLSDFHTDYPTIAIQINEGEDCFYLDLEYCYAFIEQEILEELLATGAIPSLPPRTSTETTLWMSERACEFASDLAAAIFEPNETDEVIAREFGYHPAEMTSQEAGTLIANAALILDTDGLVIGELALEYFECGICGYSGECQNWRRKHYKKWQDPARARLREALNDDLTGLEDALGTHLTEVARRCLALD